MTTLLYALGMDQEGIVNAYYDTVTYTHRKDDGWATKFFPERYSGTRPAMDVVDAASGEVVIEAGKKVTPRQVKKLRDAGDTSEILVPFDALIGKFAARDIIDETTGAIFVRRATSSPGSWTSRARCPAGP